MANPGERAGGVGARPSDKHECHDDSMRQKQDGGQAGNASAGLTAGRDSDGIIAKSD
jgi:hypothetical protein